MLWNICGSNCKTLRSSFSSPLRIANCGHILLGRRRALESVVICNLDEGALSNEEVRVLPDTSMDLLRLDRPTVAHTVEMLAIDLCGQVPGSEHAVRSDSKDASHGIVKREAF
jgi:hypothetical protein